MCRLFNITAMNKWDKNIQPYMREIEDMAAGGASTKEIAAKLNVAYSTFRKYYKEHEELAAALQRGKNRARRVIEKALTDQKAPAIMKTGGTKRTAPYVKSTLPRPDQQG